jgi:protein-S-isoprenylcysteine O-methyltransferase Ste14
VLFPVEALLQQGVPHVQWWALALLAWGYLQYRWVGTYRTRLGGGGPGVSVPPERIVVEGPYRWVRNPMYLGHPVFLAGLALFGASYREYRGRVKRWLPGVFRATRACSWATRSRSPRR